MSISVKDKTGVLTCGQFKSVNNHSERRAIAEAVISHKSIALLNRYKSLGALIVFHCYSVLLPISTKEASSIKDFSGKTVQFNTQQSPMTAPGHNMDVQYQRLPL